VAFLFLLVVGTVSADWINDDTAETNFSTNQWIMDDIAISDFSINIPADASTLTIVWAIIIFLIPLVMQFLLGRVGAILGIIIAGIVFGMTLTNFIPVSLIMVGNAVLLFYKGDY